MAASGAAAGAAFEMIGRCEDHIRPFEVIVFGFERGGRVFVHVSILSWSGAALLEKRPRAIGRIEA
jgi:hypothetical protein